VTTRRLRLLYVIDSLVPAGAERSLVELSPELQRRGVDLQVAHLLDRPGLQDELAGTGASVICLAGPGGRRGALTRVRRCIRQVQPQLVHTTLFEADVAGRVGAALERVPVVSSVVSDLYGPTHAGNPELVAWKVRATQVVNAATMRLTRRVHAVSVTAATAVRRRLRYPADRIDVIHRGRDPSVLGRRTAERRHRARAALGLGADDAVVLAVARHERAKGLDLLVDAAGELVEGRPGLRFLVAGRPGRATGDLHRRISGLGLTGSVQLLGERADVAELMCAADVVAVPSRSEGFPGVVVEALALEAPLVVSDIAQVREAATEGTALFVQPGSGTTLAGGLSCALADRAAAVLRARRGRSHFDAALTTSRIGEEMMGFYHRALGWDAVEPEHRAERSTV